MITGVLSCKKIALLAHFIIAQHMMGEDISPMLIVHERIVQEALATEVIPLSVAQDRAIDSFRERWTLKCEEGTDV